MKAQKAVWTPMGGAKGAVAAPLRVAAETSAALTVLE